jgi:uncharacterized protein (TIGR03437 family)
VSSHIPARGSALAVALSCISFATAIGGTPTNSIIGPSQSLVTTFTLPPNNADLLWFFDNTALSTSGFPSISGRLFDNGTLLGTFTQVQTVGLEMVFESPLSPYTYAGNDTYPLRADLSSLNKGTTTGCLVVTVTRGSISLSLSDIVFYDGISAGSNSFVPQPGLVVTSMAITGGSISPPPSISTGGVVNAASYLAGAGLAPGSIASVFGAFTQICPAGSTSIPLPISLSGLSMQSASGVQAPLFYASESQVNLQIPWELASQPETTLAATVNGQSGAGQTLSIAPFSPGIFATNSQGTGQGAILDTSYRLVDLANPAVPGTTVISIYCTGLGQVTNPPATGSPALSQPLSWTVVTPTVTIGGVPATVTFSGLAPNFVGLYQVNALVPAAAPDGPQVPVVISMGGVDSNAVTIALH